MQAQGGQLRTQAPVLSSPQIKDVQFRNLLDNVVNIQPPKNRSALDLATPRRGRTTR